MATIERAEWEEFIETVKANVRAHAGYFSWLTDRDVEELGVVQSLHDSLAQYGESFFHSYQLRGRGSDPPDCEAISNSGGRVGLEVTELVDSNSVEAAKVGRSIPWNAFSQETLRHILIERIAKKDDALQVKGGPYDKYILVVYCDEPRVLDYHLIEYVRSEHFPKTKLIDRAFLLFSYNPREKCCPYIELKLDGV